MYLDKSGKFVRTDIWREGKWLDFWSVVHFLSGATLGFIPKYFNIETFSAFVITFLILVLYEMFEALAKIEETPQNRIMDVVVGMISFTLGYILHKSLGEPMGSWFLGVLFVLAATLSAIGWRASQKAVIFETNLRLEIALRRDKRKEKRMRRRREKKEGY